MSTKIYIHEQVKKVYQLHQQAIESSSEDVTILDQILSFGDNLYHAWLDKNPVCIPQINNWHPKYVGKDADYIFNADFDLSDARLSIAKDCGFQSMEEVDKLFDTTFNLVFENAVDSLLNGDLATLKEQIAAQPSLLKERSQYGHQATLLHYAGSNGVEMWRQKTPYNLPEIVQFLLDAGADKNATMAVYGGHFTTWEMVATSAHPHAAGVVDDLKKLLK